MPVVKAWLLSHRAARDDVLAHPEEYPALVSWVAICQFARDGYRQAWAFLQHRVFRLVPWRNPKLRNHLGYLGKDVSQELALHFLDAVLDESRHVEPWVAYLRTAARNRYLDLVDSAETENRPALDPERDMPIEEEGLDRAAAFRDLASLFARAGLSPREQQYAWLLALGYSPTDAAHAMGILPTSTAYLRRSIATRLRKFLPK